ncbi:MAG TPA: hypothetical protein VE888_25105 [Streptosporangiaceae bacterium]|nr:hypothetical protein [Streptosporangiaceae bacterium]
MTGSSRGGSPPRRHSMIRPARVSSARNCIVAAAMSAGDITGGRPASASGVIRLRDRREAGVSTSPGQMQLARTAMVSRSGARQAVNRTTPALATAYSGESWLAVPSPAVEAMLMIAPPPRSRIGARTSCVASMTARRFRSSARSHLAGSAGKHGSSLPPALLTSTPTGPAASTAAWTPARSARSVRTNEPPTRSAVIGPCLSSRSAMTTCMPSAASRSAIPAPIPSAPPVTRAVFPLRSIPALSVRAPTFRSRP